MNAIVHTILRRPCHRLLAQVPTDSYWRKYLGGYVLHYKERPMILCTTGTVTSFSSRQPYQGSVHLHLQLNLNFKSEAEALKRFRTNEDVLTIGAPVLLVTF